MKNKFVPEDSSLKKPFYWGISSIIIILLIIAYFWRSLPPEIPLFYSKPRGESQLAKTFLIIIPIATSLLFLLINSVITQFLTPYILLRKILILGATTVCILSFITVIRIIFLTT